MLMSTSCFFFNFLKKNQSGGHSKCKWMDYGAHEGAVGLLDLWCRAIVVHEKERKHLQVAMPWFRGESYSRACGSPASHTFTPRQQVIAQHRSVASPFGCRASRCVNCKHATTHQVGNPKITVQSKVNYWYCCCCLPWCQVRFQKNLADWSHLYWSIFSFFLTCLLRYSDTASWSCIA